MFLFLMQHRTSYVLTVCKGIFLGVLFRESSIKLVIRQMVRRQTSCKSTLILQNCRCRLYLMNSDLFFSSDSSPKVTVINHKLNFSPDNNVQKIAGQETSALKRRLQRHTLGLGVASDHPGWFSIRTSVLQRAGGPRKLPVVLSLCLVSSECGECQRESFNHEAHWEMLGTRSPEYKHSVYECSVRALFLYSEFKMDSAGASPQRNVRQTRICLFSVSFPGNLFPSAQKLAILFQGRVSSSALGFPPGNQGQRASPLNNTQVAGI